MTRRQGEIREHIQIKTRNLSPKSFQFFFYPCNSENLLVKHTTLRRSGELKIIKNFYGTIDIKGDWGTIDPFFDKRSVTYTNIIDLQ